MTADTAPHGDDYATWDAPYLLGALDRDQRLEYEAHLSGCDECRLAVADLSGLPGLLSHVPDDVALSLLDDESAADHAGSFGDAGFDALLNRVRAGEATTDGAGMLPFESRPVTGPAAGSGSAEPDGAAGTSTVGETPAETGRTEPQEPPASLAAARERKRSRSGPWLGLAGAVAAAAAAVAITIPITVAHTEHNNPPTAEQVVTERQMDQVIPSPITANFTLTQLRSGTRVNMSCNYASSDTDYTWDGALWVVHTDGTQSMVAQWTAHPGQTVTADGITSAAPDQIRSVEIRSTTTNQVFLRGTV
ncbi:anti-sigma factor family protein [Nocardia mikamii]|uniref:anti-sigma factor family protein n=1 Tax=Nocardia mikamii TaxID=508464 RepID=UPI0007A38724|nr:zf-HC2 domain-containing protein [Nocardia mikamii]